MKNFLMPAMVLGTVFMFETNNALNAQDYHPDYQYAGRQVQIHDAMRGYYWTDQYEDRYGKSYYRDAFGHFNRVPAQQ